MIEKLDDKKLTDDVVRETGYMLLNLTDETIIASAIIKVFTNEINKIIDVLNSAAKTRYVCPCCKYESDDESDLNRTCPICKANTLQEVQQ